MLFRSVSQSRYLGITDPYNIPLNLGAIKKGATITIADPLQIYNKSNLDFWVTQQIGHSPIKMTVNEIGQGVREENEFIITPTNMPTNDTWWIRMIQSTQQQALVPFPLDELDTLRDEILAKKGNQAFYLVLDNESSTKIANIFNQRGNNNKLKTSRPQYGLLIKTYNSDLYQNWISIYRTDKR